MFYYYHGSPHKFSKFDFTKSKGFGMCLTPHRDYAIQFAKKENGKGYLYTIKHLTQDPDIQWSEWLQNVTIGNDIDFQIIEVEEID